MAAISGVLNHNTTAAQALAGTSATPKTMAASSSSGTSSTSSASNSAATISSNDFLTLLVTEMKNQDPTATTDPNEYINQLVNVNSLEQLISINQTLTTDLAPTSSSTSGGATGQTSTPSGSGAKTQSSTGGSAFAGAPTVASGSSSTLPSAISAAASQLSPGNLSVPKVNQSAQTVAQSLSGRARVQ